MEIPVLLEPTATGFRASMQSPVPLSAEGGTESAAMAALTTALRGRLPNGGKIRTLNLTESETMQELADRLRNNPVHAEMERAIEEYRKIANAVPDAD